MCPRYAGPLAPIALVLVSIVLYFFRFIYSEVVTALPINGGTYNALLNTTSKSIASIAACLSLLSYIATAVVSAYSAVQYIQPIWLALQDGGAATGATILILATFAGLTLFGIGESSIIAILMFTLHYAMMTALIIMSFVFAFRDGWHIFQENVYSGFPTLAPNDSGQPGYALFLGFAAALLGISGFETAANYVEEMKDAEVYVNTIRNMWICAAIFNPLISFCAMAVMPMAEIYENSSNLLAPLAAVVGGDGMHVFVCIDGVIVLSGAVLTAYVGVVGLVNRLALDHIMPEFFMHTNTLRGTQHWTILGFFAFCASLFLILATGSSHPAHQMDDLSGVYALAFLSVMCAFAISCLVLKMTRPDLPRLAVTRPWIVILALAMVFVGLVGTIVKNPKVVSIFVLYFFVILSVVIAMSQRGRMLRLALYMVRSCTRSNADKFEEQMRLAHERTSKIGHEAVARDAIGVSVSWSPVASRTSDGAELNDDAVDVDAPDVDAPEADTSAFEAVLSSARLGFFTPEAFAITDHNELETINLNLDENEGLSAHSCSARLLRWLKRNVRKANENTVAFFAKNADFVTLNRAVLYVRDNEQCSHICIVHFVDDRDAVRSIQERLAPAPASVSNPSSASSVPATPEVASAPVQPPPLEPRAALRALAEGLPPLPAEAWLLIDNCALLDTVYPAFQIDCLVVRGSYFSPAAIPWLAKHLNIKPNFCFMAMPDARFDYKISSLGGVRLIMTSDARDQRTRNVARTRAVISRCAEDIWDHEVARETNEEAQASVPESPRKTPLRSRPAVTAAMTAARSPRRQQSTGLGQAIAVVFGPGLTADALPASHDEKPANKHV